MNELAVPLAVIACCLAGAIGGYALARPREALGELGLEAPAQTGAPLAAMRAAGGLLLLAHGAVAAMLGYQPWFGATMAVTLALAWAGAAVGRLVGALRDRPRDPRAIQTIAFEALMAVTLALPYWAGPQIAAGPTLIA